MPDAQPQKEQQIRVEIGDDIADGLYANIAFIAHNNAEFVLDFARFLPGNTRAKVMSRVVMGPTHAKLFLKSLEIALEQYEKKFGAISPEPAHKNIGFQVKREE